MTTKTISAEFPFESKYVDVHGSKMHYIDEGEGDPILFLHGNATSSYLWRNIIPYLVPHGRCIAPDLIGMGKSDKPNLDYHFFDHVKYVEGFIEKMGLKNVTLVIHDWGSALGFHYAMRHESNIKAIAFMEAHFQTQTWEEFPDDFRFGFKLFRTPVIGWFLISVLNMFPTAILQQGVERKLSKEEKDYYQAPFKTIKSRKPLRMFPTCIPVSGQPQDMYEVETNFIEKLKKSNLPKMLFHATPGAIINEEGVAWCKKHYSNLKTVDIGAGNHFIQEDNPHMIGEELAKWYQDL